MPVFMETITVSLAANESKTVWSKTAKAGETLKLKYVIYSATGTAGMEIFHEATRIVNVTTEKLPPDEVGLKPEITASPGEKIEIVVKDLSGAANTVSIFLVYERTTA